MKKIILTVFLAASAVFVSCKNDDNVAEIKKLPKSITSVSGNLLFSYSTSGQLVKVTDKDSETGEMIDFAGIYTGNGQLIYSPYPGEKVKFADLNSSYWQNCFSRAVRVALNRL